jgi:hypothetical protein
MEQPTKVLSLDAEMTTFGFGPNFGRVVHHKQPSRSELPRVAGFFFLPSFSKLNLDVLPPGHPTFPQPFGKIAPAE